MASIRRYIFVLRSYLYNFLSQYEPEWKKNRHFARYFQKYHAWKCSPSFCPQYLIKQVQYIDTKAWKYDLDFKMMLMQRRFDMKYTSRSTHARAIYIFKLQLFIYCTYINVNILNYYWIFIYYILCDYILPGILF